MKEPLRSYLQLHTAVFLFGFTAILGDLIQLPFYMIVWWRVLITSASFVFILKSARRFWKLPTENIRIYIGIGVLTGLHWIFFFSAIQFSNASITLVMLATTSFFTAFLEPLVFRKKVSLVEIALGIIIVPAMIMIINNIAFSMRWGLLFGLLSALLAAFFTTLNKKYLISGEEEGISFIELASAWVFITLAFPVFNFLQPIERLLPSGKDWIYLIILSLVCTTLAYVLALKALNHLSAFASSLTINLEPIYGILLAILILKEHKELNLNFYFGVAVILMAVMSYPIFRRWQRRKTLSI